MRLLRLLPLPLLGFALFTTTPASASTTTSTPPAIIIPATGPYTIPAVLALPSGYHVTSLGNLYSLAGAHRVLAATVNTQLNVVEFLSKNNGYVAQYVAGSSIALVNRLEFTDHVNVTVSTAPILTGVLSTGSSSLWEPLVAFAIAAALIVSILIAKKRNPFRRSRARVGVHSVHSHGVEDVPTTTFADVAGADEAVDSMQEFVDFLKDPAKYEKVGAVRPKGALLVGPPGTGKTLLARAVAGEAKVPFFAVSGSDFVEMFVGVGPKRVRDLFARAKKVKSSIIFIDEIDAVARRRGADHSPSDAERDGTLIALLAEMDGFDGSNVIVLAATNRPDILDPAIVRPGRLDRRIEVPRPDRRGRETILRVHAATRPLDSDVDLVEVASRTSGLSGADLANIVNEAAICAAKRDASLVTGADFDSAVMSVQMGRARTSALVTESDRSVTAWHEAGHTVCAYLQEAADPPVSVSIIPRGPAGGVTAMSQGDDNFLQRSKAAAQLVTALAGRAAEQRLLGDDYTQGSYGDLSSATELATRVATSYGMTSLGLRVRMTPAPGQSHHDEVGAIVELLLSRALDEATRVLEQNQPFLSAVTAALLAEDTLDSSAIALLYEKAGSPPHIPAARTLAAVLA